MVAGDDGNVYRFQPFSSAYAITITHGANVIELVGDTNWDMGGNVAGLADYIDLIYIHATTELNEGGRKDANPP